MKRFLLFSLSLLAFFVANAQQHWTYREGQFSNEMFVYVDLTVGQTTLTTEADYNKYEFAAFVGNQLRSVGQVVRNTAIKTEERYFVRFRIEGDTESEADPSISFKVYDKNAQLEYDASRAAPGADFVPETIMFTGESIVPSSPLHLYITKVTAITLDNIFMNVGEMVNPLDYLNITPANATLPNNIQWLYGENAENYYGFKKVDDVYMIKAVAPNTNGAPYALNIDKLTAEGRVYIYQPATAFTRTQAEITVAVDDIVTNLLGGCYTLSPDNTTDQVKWTSANERIVGQTEKIGVLMAYSTGDVVLTGTVYDQQDKVRSGIDPITVTVHVVQPVTGITTTFVQGVPNTFMYCNVGDVLNPYLVDGKAFSILPRSATNKKVTMELANDLAGANEDALTIDNEGTITATALGWGFIRVTSDDNPSASTVICVYVNNDVTQLTVKESTKELALTDNPESIDLGSNLTKVPADANRLDYMSVSSSDTEESVISIADIMYDGGQPYFMVTPKGVGTATITVTYRVMDWLASNFPTGADNETFTTTKTVSFDVKVSRNLTGLEVVYEGPNPSAGNYNGKLVVTPVPAGAPMDDDYLEVEYIYENGSKQWAYFPEDVLSLSSFESGENGSVVANVDNEKNIPGKVKFTVTYDDGTNSPITVTSEPQDVGYRFDIKGGWEWRTIPYGTFNGLNDVFGGDLIEIRTQNKQVYNDPQYGFFGDLDLLGQNVCFKMKTSEVRPEVSDTYLYNGTLGINGSITLRRGWNWIPNPYVFKRFIDHIQGTFVEGDRIVSMDDGFVEYTDDSESLAESNGPSWTGDLELLKPGQGYLFYNAGDAGRTLTFEDEMDMTSCDDDYAWRSRMASAPKPSLYTYDASRFRDNMTIVATVDNLPVTDDCTVYAFVGDECRGTGKVIGGRLFITAHGENGEIFSFKLHNQQTDELFDISQTARMQPMLGTVKAPYRMEQNGLVTRIVDASVQLQQDGNTYDLQGREVNSMQKGIIIRRSSDGRVMKTVVR